jgi:hypothetical protein
VGVGDDIDFPSYLVTVDDIVDSAPQLPIASEPESRFGTVPRYHAHFGPSGTAKSQASKLVCPVKSATYPSTQPVKTHFVGLTRNKVSGINSSRIDGVEGGVYSSSDMYGTDFETYRECLPYNGQSNFLSPNPEDDIAQQFETFDVPPDSSAGFAAASAAKSYISRSTESKRSAREIMAMLSEEVICPSNSFDTPQFKPQKAELSKEFSVKHSVENDWSALSTASIPKTVWCDEVTDLGFSVSSSTDWAPVVPAAKKQRLGVKGPLTTMASNNSGKTAPSHPISACSHERSGYSNPLLRGVSSAAGHTSKYIIQRNTDPLNFPSANECAEPISRRNIVVPATFPSWHEYARLFTAAVHEEINLRVREMALMFYKVCQVQ